MTYLLNSNVTIQNVIILVILRLIFDKQSISKYGSDQNSIMFIFSLSQIYTHNLFITTILVKSTNQFHNSA